MEGLSTQKRSNENLAGEKFQWLKERDKVSDYIGTRSPSSPSLHLMGCYKRLSSCRKTQPTMHLLQIMFTQIRSKGKHTFREIIFCHKREPKISILKKEILKKGGKKAEYNSKKKNYFISQYIFVIFLHKP